MKHMTEFLKDRGQRSLMAAGGLLVCALGTYFELQANIGMAPWESLNQGIAMKTGISYGLACQIISFLVIAADLLLHERIGIGTIFDALIVGAGVDFCTNINLVPVQTTLVGQDSWVRCQVCRNLSTVLYEYVSLDFLNADSVEGLSLCGTCKGKGTVCNDA